MLGKWETGNWAIILSVAEFVCNNSVNKSIAKSTFEIILCYFPCTHINLLPLPFDNKISGTADLLLNMFMIYVLKLGTRLFSITEL